MGLQVFTLPFNKQKRSFDDSKLKEFLKSSGYRKISDYLFEKDGDVYLTLLIDYESDTVAASKNSGGEQNRLLSNPAENQSFPGPKNSGNIEIKGDKGGKNGSTKKTKIDESGSTPTAKTQTSKPYQPTRLNKRQLRIFETMRKWRFERARNQVIPAYMICSNIQLEEMILKKPATIHQLAMVKGMEGMKAGKHGESILAALNSAFSESDSN